MLIGLVADIKMGFLFKIIKKGRRFEREGGNRVADQKNKTLFSLLFSLFFSPNPLCPLFSLSLILILEYPHLCNIFHYI